MDYSVAANFNFKAHLRKYIFFIFWAIPCVFGFNVFQKYDLKNLFGDKSKKVSKTLISDPLQKFQKLNTKKL